MSWNTLAVIAVALASLPATMVLWNLLLFRAPPRPRRGSAAPRVSVLIPARDEQVGIEAAVNSALASRGVEVEVIVLDDHSHDDTARIVRSIAQRDPRVRLEPAPALPAGWCGKQHACHVLSRLAGNELLAWIDADVRLGPDALARLVAFRQRRAAGLVSAFPHQRTETLLETLVVNLINFVLMGYLPFALMRLTNAAGFGVGCGQLFLADRDAYRRAGGHEGIRLSLHDGVTLPRAFRRAGIGTDCCDGADLATCRMYRDAGAVWRGFAKNATEGMATPVGIITWSVLLLGGHVLPWILLVPWFLAPSGSWTTTGSASAVTAAAMAGAVSLTVMTRFGQPALAGLLRPVGIVILVSIQWYALSRKLLGRPTSWRGRPYTAG